MRKILVLLTIMLGTATIAFSQVSYSTVTATVTDPNGNPYANAALTATLVNSEGYPVSSASTPNGQLFNAKKVLATLDATGYFSIQLVQNNILSKPSGTSWAITIIYPQDTAILTTQPPWTVRYTVSVTGPIDLSSQISNLTQAINFVNLTTGQSTLLSRSGCQGGNIIANGCTGATTAAGALHNLGAEPALGNPSANGYLLSSTMAGVRSWVAPSSGGMIYPGAGVALSTGSAWGSPLAYGTTGNSVLLQTGPGGFISSSVVPALSYLPSGGTLTSGDWCLYNGTNINCTVTPITDTSQLTNGAGFLTGNQSITLSGDVTGSGTTAISTSIGNTTVTGKLLTGYVSGPGTVAATDSILTAIQKLNGNIGSISVPVASSTTPLMDGVAAIGTGTTWARADHVHPSDTSRVATTTTVNGHALSGNVVVSASDLTTGTLPSSAEPAHTGDAINTAGSLGMTVVGIKGMTVPTLATGYLYYNGSTFAWQTASGVTPNSLTAGSGLSGTAFNGSAAVTWTLATAYGDTTNPYASKTANYVLAAPNGSAGVPTFRAIVASDIPTLNQSTSGTAANITATSNSTLASLTALTTASSLASIGTVTTGVWNASVVGSQYGGTGVAGTLTGILYGNGTGPHTVASTAQVGTSIAAYLATLTGCSTANYVYTPQGANCVAQSGGGITALTGDVTASGSGSVAATVAGIKGVTVPTLSAGYLYYNGSAYVWQTPSGTGTINAAAQYDLPYYSATGSASTVSGAAITGPVCATTGAAPTACSAATLASTIGTTAITNSTNTTNLLGATVDSIPYQSAASTTGYLAPQTTNGTYVVAEVVTASAAVAPTLLNLSTYLASPPAIGGTTAAAGAFSSLVINGGTAMTGSAGTGGYAQETTSAAKTSGNLAKFDSNGNTIDAGYSVAAFPTLGAASNTFTGYQTATYFVSNVATGTAPFTVTSTTPVTNLSIGGNAATTSAISGMTTGQVAIAGATNTITSSKALAGSGAGITTGPTTTTSGDCVKFNDASGTLADAGAACGSGGGGISGLTSGYIPLAGGTTTLTGNSPLDYGVTTASTLTSSKSLAVTASAIGSVGAVINGFSSSQTADLLDVNKYSGLNVFSVGNNGAVNATGTGSFSGLALSGPSITGPAANGITIGPSSSWLVTTVLNLQGSSQFAAAGSTFMAITGTMKFGSSGGTTTGGWNILSLKTNLGNGTTDVYQGSTPMTGLLLNPTINVATTSTVGYCEICSLPIETSLGTGVANYFIKHAPSGGSLSTPNFSVTQAGLITTGAAGSTSGSLAIASAGGGSTTINTASTASSYQFTIPALTANDVPDTLGLAQTITGAKTFNNNVVVNTTTATSVTVYGIGTTMALISSGANALYMSGSSGSGNNYLMYQLSQVNQWSTGLRAGIGTAYDIYDYVGGHDAFTIAQTTELAAFYGPVALGTQNSVQGTLAVNGSASAGGAITLYGTGVSPGSSVLSVNTAGTTLNLGSSSATVTTAGAGAFSGMTVASSPVGLRTTLTTGTTTISTTCSSNTASTVTLTGVTTANTINITPTIDISSVSGWSGGSLYFDAWPTANTINYRVCTGSGTAVTPGGSVTWNVSVQ